jgi:hypothetical protein
MASMLAFQSSAGVPQTAPDQTEVSPVPLVVCHEGHSYVSGSAFRIGNGLFLSVNHVTSNHNCQMDGAPLKVLYHSGDFSMLADYRPGRFIPVDCSGFHEGQRYIAVGHARGMDDLTIVPLIATGKSVDGYAVLVGIFTVQPGMSGGAIVDADTGKVVGTVNAANWEDGTSFSIALKDTPVCASR